MQITRVKALGIIRRNNDLLVLPILEKTGNIKGYRPVGGTMEYREKAEETLVREFREELGADIKVNGLMTVFENIYELDDMPYHEIIFFYHAEFTEPHFYDHDELDLNENGTLTKAYWMDADQLAADQMLLPPGLKAFL